MEYERIQKPSSNHSQGGGFSPSKLRAILLGVQKERKEAEGFSSGFAFRSDENAIDERGASVSENCKDVDVVSSPLPVGAYKSKDHNLVSSSIRPQEDDSCDSDSTSSSSVFEFHKSVERAPVRSPMMPPFLKPAPSKWDDAQKWISSPTSNRGNKAGSDVHPKRSSLGGYGSKSFGPKVVLEVTDEVDTKRIDQSQAKKDIGGYNKAANWAPEPFPLLGSDRKSSVFENPFADTAVNLGQRDASTAVQTATSSVAPSSTVGPVSMRDMGTEMTPIASKEPSRTGTPNRAITPTRSPTSSRPLSPARTAPDSTIAESTYHSQNSEELSEKELKMKTRREIMVLGQQLGKVSIAAWANKEQEENDATVRVDQPATSTTEARAAAWEDAEKAKYLARFKQEEIKIQAWENHQKAKTEAEMKKIEVEVERMRARANERLMNKLASASHKADEKRVAAEARRNKQAARTAQEAEYIRRTGRIPSTHSCWGLCS